MESLPVLPLELLGLAAGETALEPASRRQGAAALLPRGSPEDLETGPGLEILRFADLIALPVVQAGGGELPSGGNGLPPAPPVPRAVPLEIETIAGQFRAVTDEPGVLQTAQPTQPLPPVTERQGFGPRPVEALFPPPAADAARAVAAEYGDKGTAAERDQVLDLLPPRPAPAVTLSARSDVSRSLEIESADVRIWQPQHSQREAGSVADSAKDRGLRALSEALPSSDSGRLTETPLPESRGIFRAVSAPAGVEFNSALLPATQAPATSATPLAELTQAPGTSETLQLGTARWGDALANRLSWMIDSDLGEARIRLNPPELGALDVKISMVEEKAFVQLFASEPAAKELLESALPKLRELLGAGGIELADASVNDRKRESPAAMDNSERPPDSPDSEQPAAAEARVKRPPPGRIDLFA